MTFFTKSVKSDLGKQDVQHRVVCDWLRNIDKKLIQQNRLIRDFLQEVQSSSPSGESSLDPENFEEDDHSSNPQI